jgi:hypothetical protein
LKESNFIMFIWIHEYEINNIKRIKIMKVIIVGGVAGGASCAARLRRLDEKIQILILEREPFVSDFRLTVNKKNGF